MIIYYSSWCISLNFTYHQKNIKKSLNIPNFGFLPEKKKEKKKDKTIVNQFPISVFK